MIELNKIYCMDCLEGMKMIDDNSVDAVVTDPPYFLINESGKGFMGKEWDSVPKSKEKSNISLIQEFHYKWAKEAFRVLKPGGHLLSFGGTRTYHRMACAIEDAGFEVRDMVEWIFSTGFPKSLNVGKKIDELQGNEREYISESPFKRSEEAEERSAGKCQSGKTTHPDMTKGTSEWEGWGTSLKPAHEPICLARKPISENSIAENVLKWGTGGINIDGSRVQTTPEDAKAQLRALSPNSSAVNGKGGAFSGDIYGEPSDNFINTTFNPTQGRFPANLIHDGSDEVVKLFPEQKSGSRSSQYKIGDENGNSFNHGIYGKKKAIKFPDIPSSSGSASRFFKSCKWTEEDLSFFYTPKAPKDERDMGMEGMEEQEIFRAGHGNEENDDVTKRFRTMMKNVHPTCKPLSLILYLVRLITPPKGLVLDPFMGSGTTAIACKKLGMNFIGFEINPEYVKIAEKRLSAVPKRLDKFGI